MIEGTNTHQLSKNPLCADDKEQQNDKRVVNAFFYRLRPFRQQANSRPSRETVPHAS